ncbi:hypothetical protein CPB85DRAFT_1323525 [Mucidula mucida]|nr:hypothetical protein CPB85DRAFT_1323525 [Mucidula mucida]
MSGSCVRNLDRQTETTCESIANMIQTNVQHCLSILVYGPVQTRKHTAIPARSTNIRGAFPRAPPNTTDNS